MSAQEDLSTLLQWCRDTPCNARSSVVELDYWGYCATNARLDITWFTWFPTHEDMLNYFGCCWPYNYHEAQESVDADGSIPLRVARYGEYTRQYAQEEMRESDYLACLSRAHPDVTVHQLGTVAALMDGDDPFAREWRSEFRMTGGSDDFTPIRPDEEADFWDAIGSDQRPPPTRRLRIPENGQAWWKRSRNRRDALRELRGRTGRLWQGQVRPC